MEQNLYETSQGFSNEQISLPLKYEEFGSTDLICRKPDAIEVEMKGLNERLLVVSSHQISLSSTSSHEAKSVDDFTSIKPEPDDLEYNVNKISQIVSNEQFPLPLKCEVKEEIMYCQFCPYSDVDFDRLKFHTFTQHPTEPAVVKFGESDHDFKFFCVKETCNFSTTMCTDYEEHLMNCCPLHQILSGKEKERLNSIFHFVVAFHNKHSLMEAVGFLEYFSSFNKTYTGTSEDDQAQFTKHVESNDLFSDVSRSSSLSNVQSFMLCEDAGGRKLEDSNIISVSVPVPVFIVQNQNKNLIEIQKTISESSSVSIKKQNQKSERLLKTSPSEMSNNKSQIHTRKESQTKKKPFPCVISDKCSQLTYCEGDFPTHTKICSAEKSYMCDVCGKAFSRSQNLTVHKRLHTGPLTCHLCYKRFCTSSRFQRHMNLHSDEKSFKCDVCHLAFKKSTYLTRHKRTHSGEKPFKCDVCYKSFFDNPGLIKHKKGHMDEKPFKCSVCDKGFVYSSMLMSHKLTHKGEKKFITGRSQDLIEHNRTPNVEKFFKCDVCGKDFRQHSHLVVHKITHTGEKPFKCSVCAKKFARSQDFRVHKRIHMDEKPFQCDVCGKDFRQRSHLVGHKRRHTGEKPFKCSVCSKEFTSSPELIVHKRSHTGEKPFKCSECGKGFVDSGTLTQHKRTHTGEKPFKCSICDKKYTRSYDLNVHKRRHTGERPFTCSVCHKNFADSRNLLRHKNKQHTIVESRLF